MRIIGLTIFLITLLASCQEKKIESFDVNILPKDWVKLTENEGELVVYNSCDAGNLLLTIKENGNENQLLLYGQQEDYEFNILENQKLNDTILIDAQWKDSDEKQKFKFVWMDKQKGLGRWITTYSNGFTSNNVFVISEKQTDFKRVDQPCRECWGDECDEIEDDNEIIDNPIDSVQKVFDNYVQYQESTDSPYNKILMKRSLESLDSLIELKDLEILINVWMYYDPTDFPSRTLVYRILKESRPASVIAVQKRIDNKLEWETDNSAPYSELTYLKEKLEGE